MQLQLTDEQITRARALRAEGKSYAEIKDEIGADVERATIRQHCLDVRVEGKARSRTDKGPMQGKDGRTIKPYSEGEDIAIIAWVINPNDDKGTMAALAQQLGRLRHSVAARIKTLRKHGHLPAE